MSRMLVFTACFNERDNIGALIDQIARNLPRADILVVDVNELQAVTEAGCLYLPKRKIPKHVNVENPEVGGALLQLHA
jgi:hypothetical protein